MTMSRTLELSAYMSFLYYSFLYFLVINLSEETCFIMFLETIY